MAILFVIALAVHCYSLVLDDGRFAFTNALGVIPKYRVKARENVNKSEYPRDKAVCVMLVPSADNRRVAFSIINCCM